VIQPLDAILLGTVEGLTEFLPVSSTGHLILTAQLLGLHSEAAKTFEVVIQAGALLAAAALYRSRVAAMWRGLWGADPAGRNLLLNLLIGTAPALVAGLLFHRAIKAHLFAAGPVILALAVGGLVMIGVDRWVGPRARASSRTLDSVTRKEALLIGLAQCVSLWPGTSRAMVTMLAGLGLGLPPAAAAELSFLLALPTLGAATLFDALHGGSVLLQEASAVSLACGFLFAAVVAAAAMTGFVRYVVRRGLAPFGWYRIGLAAAVWSLARP